MENPLVPAVVVAAETAAVAAVENRAQVQAHRRVDQNRDQIPITLEKLNKEKVR
jgi:hypothetical protein